MIFGIKTEKDQQKYDSKVKKKGAQCTLPIVSVICRFFRFKKSLQQLSMKQKGRSLSSNSGGGLSCLARLGRRRVYNYFLRICHFKQ